VKRGLTLVEIIFAAALLSLTFLAVLNVVPTSVIAEKRAQNRVVADALAQNQIERARAVPFSQLAADGVERALGTHTVNKTVFRVSQTVTEASATHRLKDVVVTVTWDDPGVRGNGTRRVTARAMVFNETR
jgi:Tfp pilus assembly protein PilV